MKIFKFFGLFISLITFLIISCSCEDAGKVKDIYIKYKELKEKYEQLKHENEQLKKENRKLKEEIQEYKGLIKRLWQP